MFTFIKDMPTITKLISILHTQLNLTTMSYSASIIAFAFVKRGIDEGTPITQMKLQKMLYFAQGLHLVLNNRNPLLLQSFQAWKYGPVIPDIYQEYKFYGSQPITDTFYITFSLDDTYEKEVEALDERAKKTISLTWDSTKFVDTMKLSNWTHSIGSPWQKCYQDGVSDITIPNDEIYEYFTKFVKMEQPA